MRTLKANQIAGAALAGYVLVAFAYWGAGLLPHPGRRYIGSPVDPQIFIWSFSWWTHAIGNGLNPLFTHAIWAPDGVDIAWTATTPGLALAFTPLTWLAGPVVAYDVAAFLMPALAAWTAFLLCRYVTRATWPSLVGGYLFGFSGYMIGHVGGHLHMTSIFLVPVVALLVLRHVEGDLGNRGLVIRLGPVLALQIAFSTEVMFTLTLAVAAALALAFVLVPQARRRILAVVPPLAGAYAIAGALASPLLYYALRDFNSSSINEPTPYTTDLLNLVVPTVRLLVGGRWAESVSRHFAGNDFERDAYLGLPTLVIVGWFATRRLRTPGGRFLVASALAALVCSLGSWVTVDGHKIFTGPWEHVAYLPLFNNVLPSRLMLYATLATAVMVAIWAASQRGRLRIVLPALAVLALVPNVALGMWRTPAPVPAFFDTKTLARCLAPGETVLVFPQTKHGNGMLWQAVSGFRYRMADGYLTPEPPPSFGQPLAVARIANRQVTLPDLRVFARVKHVTTLLVDPSDTSEPWTSLLRPLGPPQLVGGMLVYRLAGGGPC